MEPTLCIENSQSYFPEAAVLHLSSQLNCERTYFSPYTKYEVILGYSTYFYDDVLHSTCCWTSFSISQLVANEWNAWCLMQSNEWFDVQMHFKNECTMPLKEIQFSRFPTDCKHKMNLNFCFNDICFHISFCLFVSSSDLFLLLFSSSLI